MTDEETTQEESPKREWYQLTADDAVQANEFSKGDRELVMDIYSSKVLGISITEWDARDFDDEMLDAIDEMERQLLDYEGRNPSAYQET